MLHEKMWVLPHAPLYQKCVSKKKNKMVNVYKLSILISKEEEIPYPNLPPTITTTTTAVNLSRPSYYKKQKKWK